MDFTKILRALLSKAYKKTETEIDAILSNTDEAAAENELLQLDAARVSEITKPKPGTTFQDGYAKAKKEVLSGIEARLKQAFEIEDAEGQPLTGEDLISAVVEKKAAGVNNTDLVKLSADEIKRLPGFQAIARDHTKALQTQKTELEGKISEIETGHNRAKVFGSVSEKALAVLNSLNPVLDKSETVAANRKSSFLNSLKDGIEWIEQDGVLIPMKDGKVATDEHGHALTLEDFAKTKASDWFEFSQNNGGGNSGNGGAGGSDSTGGKTNGYPKNITKPKTFDEVTAIINNKEIDAKDRETVLNVWESEHAGGTQ